MHWESYHLISYKREVFTSKCLSRKIFPEGLPRRIPKHLLCIQTLWAELNITKAMTVSLVPWGYENEGRVWSCSVGYPPPNKSPFVKQVLFRKRERTLPHFWYHWPFVPNSSIIGHLCFNHSPEVWRAEATKSPSFHFHDHNASRRQFPPPAYWWPTQKPITLLSIPYSQPVQRRLSSGLKMFNFISKLALDIGGLND